MESPAVQNARGLKLGLFTPNTPRKAPGDRGTLYGGLMAGVATPEETSEGR